MVRFRFRFSPSGPSADREKDTLSELALLESRGRIRRRNELPSRRRSSAGGVSVPRAQKAASAVAVVPEVPGIFGLRLFSWVRLDVDGPSLAEDTRWMEAARRRIPTNGGVGLSGKVKARHAGAKPPAVRAATAPSRRRLPIFPRSNNKQNAANGDNGRMTIHSKRCSRLQPDPADVSDLKFSVSARSNRGSGERRERTTGGCTYEVRAATPGTTSTRRSRSFVCAA